jgi:hypothetical protein
VGALRRACALMSMRSNKHLRSVEEHGQPSSSMPRPRQYRPLDTRSRKPHSQIAVPSTPVCARSSVQNPRASAAAASGVPVARSCMHQSRSTTPIETHAARAAAAQHPAVRQEAPVAR